MKLNWAPYQRATIAWIFLLAVTFVSWQVGHGAWFTRPLDAGTAIIIFAFVKIRVVVFQFMDVRHAPGWMRTVCNAWIILMSAVIIMLCRY